MFRWLNAYICVGGRDVTQVNFTYNILFSSEYDVPTIEMNL
jgi:hypothetical protein